MRILLNVLPEEKKQILSRRFYSRFFLWQSSLLFVLIVFYLVVLASMFFLLHYQRGISEASLASFDQYNEEAKKLVQYQEHFKEANRLTRDMGRYLDGHLQWGKVFSLLDTITPPGVALVELTTKDYTISLIGQAETREAFLEFEAALKVSACTSDVKVPISNLFAQKEIDFQLDFNIKRECLLNKH